jgi:phosphopantothenoylcysteine decarboxylase/phosphopantothenate--cysteine ligase
MSEWQVNPLQDAHILLGISGGIAAYKTPQLVRLLRQAEAEVQVVMTRSAHQFVTATALQAVSDKAVRDTLWDPSAEAAMGHIELARWADLTLIAPASADILSRLASGRADDLLCALCLAGDSPLMVAPAMNQVMWQAAATQRNLATLRADGVNILGPASGDQACGEVGPGRMVEPAGIVTALIRAITTGAKSGAKNSTGGVQFLAGLHVVVTAGPTREPLDPVRYISNLSSGKQGYAMAQAARDAGASVTLISGPVDLAPPEGIKLVRVERALDMFEAAKRLAPGCDLFIGVAAVADYRPATVAQEKIKKKDNAGDAAGITLDLLENPDIIASIARSANPPVVIGFAAETNRPLEHAREKLEKKRLHAIVVNDVSQPDIGFNVEENAATFVWAQGETKLAKCDKYDLACTILEKVSTLFVDQLARTNPADVAK